MHSRYEEVSSDLTRCRTSSSKCFGGFARVKAAVDDLRKDGKKNQMSTLYLDAGDIFQETIYFIKYKWELALKMVSLLQPDAMSLGNHEFDEGVEGLAPFLKTLSFPIVCSNINIDDEPLLNIHGKIVPSTVISFGDIKVGVVGYLTRFIPSKHLGKAIITDEIESVQKEARRLKNDGVNIIIALGHSGFIKDKEIAKKVEYVDVVVGAHSHSYLYSGKTPSELIVDGEYPTMITKENNPDKQVPVVQAYFGTKYLGRLDLTFDDDGNLKKHDGELILLNGNMKKDPTIHKELKPYIKEVKHLYRKELGRTNVLYEGGREGCRLQECNIGNLVGDAFVDYANRKLQDVGEDVHIALVDSKSIKESLYPKGNGKTGVISFGDLMLVLPYGSYLKVLRLKGTNLRQALESSVNRYDPNKEGLLRAHLLQVSGLKVHFDLTEPLGSRVVRVQVAPEFKDLDDSLSYNVAVSSYLSNNKDEFPSLIGQPVAASLPEDFLEYDILGEYIKKHTPLTAAISQVKDRITITNTPN